MNQDDMIPLLAELLQCHTPSGEEWEIDAIIRREFESTGLTVWQDEATNWIVHLPGEGRRVMVCAHKDEIGMIVTDVLPDGRLKVQNIGGSYPWKYGEGPVDVLADDGQIIRAILSVGSTHTRTGTVAALRQDKALLWEHVTLFTGMSPDELRARGVHPGSRAVVARERKQLHRLGDYIASYALDDRLGLVSLIAALKDVVSKSLTHDLYFVATSGEEIGMLGALYAAQTIRPAMCIALDTSPVAPDVPAVVDARPVIWYGEAVYNDKRDSDLLLRLAAELGFGAQPVVYNAAASDAGGVKRVGLAGRTAAFGFARDNSHGYEIAHVDSMMNVTRLLVSFLEQI